MNIIEKVSRAMFHDAFPDMFWEQVGVNNQDAWRRAARAAIKAMRDPTPNMVNYAFSKVHNLDRREKDVRRLHRFMIDAALEEK